MKYTKACKLLCSTLVCYAAIGCISLKNNLKFHEVNMSLKKVEHIIEKGNKVMRDTEKTVKEITENHHFKAYIEYMKKLHKVGRKVNIVEDKSLSKGGMYVPLLDSIRMSKDMERYRYIGIMHELGHFYDRRSSIVYDIANFLYSVNDRERTNKHRVLLEHNAIAYVYDFYCYHSKMLKKNILSTYGIPMLCYLEAHLEFNCTFDWGENYSSIFYSHLLHQTGKGDAYQQACYNIMLVDGYWYQQCDEDAWKAYKASRKFIKESTVDEYRKFLDTIGKKTKVDMIKNAAKMYNKIEYEIYHYDQNNVINKIIEHVKKEGEHVKKKSELTRYSEKNIRTYLWSKNGLTVTYKDRKPYGLDCHDELYMDNRKFNTGDYGCNGIGNSLRDYYMFLNRLDGTTSSIINDHGDYLYRQVAKVILEK